MMTANASRSNWEWYSQQKWAKMKNASGCSMPSVVIKKESVHNQTQGHGLVIPDQTTNWIRIILNTLGSTDSRPAYREIQTLRSSRPRPAVLQWKRLMPRHWRENRRSGPDGLATLRSCIVWTPRSWVSWGCWRCPGCGPPCKLWSTHPRGN